ncbi:tetratricopeptide repeat protein [Minwuia sp.]|uniref:tetratricopeptide repeat protein n=1 Tax=Minwuia sp. TaxID=2493630 RepID=UPI003A955995
MAFMKKPLKRTMAAIAVLTTLTVGTAAQQLPQQIPSRSMLNANHCDGDLEIDACVGVLEYRVGDYAGAVRIWKALAAEGDVVAQRNLGLMYQRGRGVKRDLGEAARWYRKAADQGDAGAALALGAMYQTGKGVSQNYDMAAAMYRKAIRGGSSRAAYRMAMMHRAHVARAPDLRAELRYLRTAAFRGLSDAQIEMGRYFFRRNRYNSDKVRACAFFRFAVDSAVDPLVRREASDWVFRVQDDITLDQSYHCREIAREWRQELSINGGRAPF